MSLRFVYGLVFKLPNYILSIRFAHYYKNYTIIYLKFNTSHNVRLRFPLIKNIYFLIIKLNVGNQ